MLALQVGRTVSADRLIEGCGERPRRRARRRWVAADVPLTHRHSVVLVSTRVGNVKSHGQWFTLLDQMWVR